MVGDLLACKSSSSPLSVCVVMYFSVAHLKLDQIFVRLILGKLPKVVYSVATKAKQVRVPGLNQLRGDASGRERKMRKGKKLFDSMQ